MDKLNKIKPKLEYIILRLSFIYPVHLPVLTETYLRKDFHFAMYLAYCYGQVLVKFFKWSLFSVAILAGIIIFVNLLFTIMDEDLIDQVMKFIFYLAAFIMLLCMRTCLKNAESKLIPSIWQDEGEGKLYDPENFDILLGSKANVNPFEDYKKLPKNAYLQEQATENIDDAAENILNNDEEL